MSRLIFPVLLGVSLTLCACPDQRGTDDDDDAGDDDDAVELPVIPDPGTGDNNWGFSLLPGDDPCCTLPEEAYPVGIVDAPAGYIQGVLDPDLNFFYVFQTAAGFVEFSFPLDFDDVHLHEGDGLRFGSIMEPSADDGFRKTWDVEAEHVYVVEIVSAVSGFF
jgi:hypothetical protein